MPICRNAVIFNECNGFHLRQHVLYALYNIQNVERNTVVCHFANNWQIQEQSNISKIKSKCQDLSKKIQPDLRSTVYLNERNDIFENDDKLKDILLKKREISLLIWPYDNCPFRPTASDPNVQNKRKEKYMLRTNAVDYFGNRSLPMKCFPLKLLAYWKLMQINGGIIENCLCYFDYRKMSN